MTVDQYLSRYLHRMTDARVRAAWDRIDRGEMPNEVIDGLIEDIDAEIANEMHDAANGCRYLD